MGKAFISVGQMWGNFISILIDFMVIALVVYYGVTLCKPDKLDKKKSNGLIAKET